MSGECERCQEHCLDCICSYPRCHKCHRPIYRHDGTCMNCLIEESRELILRTDLLLKKLCEGKI